MLTNEGAAEPGLTDVLDELKVLESKWEERSEDFSEGAREACPYGIDEKAEHDKCMAAMKAIDRCTKNVRELRAKYEGLSALRAQEEGKAMKTSVNDVGDTVCQHGTALDVHCCNCHSGFIFDVDHRCPPDPMTLELHRCKICGARWLLWPDEVHGGGWNLLDHHQRPGACCNNVAMGDQIEHLRDIPLKAALRAATAPQEPPAPKMGTPSGSCLVCGHLEKFAAFANGSSDPLYPRWVGVCESCRNAGQRQKLLAVSPTAPQEGWQPIETAPGRRKILVSWVNGLGNRRTALAAFWPVGTLDMGDDVPDDAVDIDGRNTEAGWFEESEANDEDYWRLTEPLTHWMPLPQVPKGEQDLLPPPPVAAHE